MKTSKRDTNNLSARRSKFSPRSDSFSRILAKYPSKKSVEAAKRKTIKAKVSDPIKIRKIIGITKKILEMEIRFGIMKILYQ